jgi:hypothetical protein
LNHPRRRVKKIFDNCNKELWIDSTQICRICKHSRRCSVCGSIKSLQQDSTCVLDFVGYIILHTQGPNLITEIYDDDDVRSSKLLLQGMKSTRPCIHLEPDRYIAILEKSYIKFKVNSRPCELLVRWHLVGD